MTTRVRLLIVVLASLFAGSVFIACRHCGALRESRLYELGPRLLKLSEVVESEVRDGEVPEGLADDDLIRRATAHDPGLVAPFHDYALRVARDGRHAVLLVCTQDRKRGLLEDAGCTYYLDRTAWKDADAPCEFSIRVRDACPSSTTPVP